MRKISHFYHGPKHRKIVKAFEQVANAVNGKDCRVQRLKLVRTRVTAFETDSALLRNDNFQKNCHGGAVRCVHYCKTIIGAVVYNKLVVLNLVRWAQKG